MSFLLFHLWTIGKLTKYHKMLSVSEICMETGKRVDLYYMGQKQAECYKSRSETEKSTGELDMEFLGGF